MYANMQMCENICMQICTIPSKISGTPQKCQIIRKTAVN